MKKYIIIGLIGIFCSGCIAIPAAVVAGIGGATKGIGIYIDYKIKEEKKRFRDLQEVRETQQ